MNLIFLYLIISFILIFLYLTTIESFNMFSKGFRHYIKKEGILFLNEELSNCFLSELNNDLIVLNKKSKLKGFYIMKYDNSILFPYYLCSYDKNDYGILLFSKSYFIVKNKYKQLKNNSKINKHLKFN